MSVIKQNSTLVTTLSPSSPDVTITATLNAYGPVGYYFHVTFAAAVFGGAGTDFTIDNKGLIESQGTTYADAGILLGSPGKIENSGTIIGGSGIYIFGTSTVVSKITNTKLIEGTLYAGAYVDGIADVTNSGTVKGDDVGIVIGGGSVINSGHIDGGFAGVLIGTAAAAYVYNAGAITADIYGVSLSGDGIVVNTGTILSQGDEGVFIRGTGAVYNYGVIGGQAYGVDLYPTGGTVINAGSIYSSAESGSAVYIGSDRGGSTSSRVSNEASGTISSKAAGILFFANGDIENAGQIFAVSEGIEGDGNITIANTGKITAIFSDGIEINGGGGTDSVTNSGLISGGQDGAQIENDDVTFHNTGTVIGSFGTGVDISGYDVAASNSKLISGAESGLYLFGDNDTSLSNSGTIMGATDEGANVTGDSVVVTNTKLIKGAFIGLDVGADLATIDNTGTLIGTFEAGLDLDAEATVKTSGLIDGGEYGIDSDGPLTLDNSGTVSGYYQEAIEVDDEATITNSGLITSVDDGIYVDDGLTLKNTGTIIATYYDAVSGSYMDIHNSCQIIGGEIAISGNAGTVVNSAGGLIQGGDKGINLYGEGAVVNMGTINGGSVAGVYLDYGTVTDSGVISGKYSVEFGYNGEGVLIITSAAKLIGGVELGGGLLDLAAGGKDGKINLSSVYGIGGLDVGAGAVWDLAGTATLGAGVVNAGTIVEGSADRLTIDGTLSGGGTIELGKHPLVLNGAVYSQTIEFTGKSEVLGIGDIGSFAGTIANFVVGDTIDLTGVSLSSITGDSFADGVFTIDTGAGDYTVTFANPSAFPKGGILSFEADGTGTGITLSNPAKPTFLTPAIDVSGSAALPALAAVGHKSAYTAEAPASGVTVSATQFGWTNTDLLKSSTAIAVPQVTLHG